MIWYELHLCEDCGNIKHFPDCRPDNAEKGIEGNIVRCKNYSSFDMLDQNKVVFNQLKQKSQKVDSSSD